jgi:hypothetical protein
MRFAIGSLVKIAHLTGLIVEKRIPSDFVRGVVFSPGVFRSSVRPWSATADGREPLPNIRRAGIIFARGEA